MAQKSKNGGYSGRELISRFSDDVAIVITAKFKEKVVQICNTTR